jgi:small subunit ribosomal protein S8
MFTDPVGDMISRIRNAQMRRKPFAIIPHSKLKEKILETLLREGYIRGFDLENSNTIEKSLKVHIKYFSGNPVIREIKRVSKPSIKIYSSIRNMKPVGNGLGNAILTTSKGVLSDREARASHVGGKILLTVR